MDVLEMSEGGRPDLKVTFHVGAEVTAKQVRAAAMILEAEAVSIASVLDYMDAAWLSDGADGLSS